VERWYSTESAPIIRIHATAPGHLLSILAVETVFRLLLGVVPGKGEAASGFFVKGR
jgi:hypothetical protein